ncbi:MAG: DUF1800 domain-containing protein [Bacteroidetes bacterium]|nr:MAG: DUF1800 domain-containing protein [Bacteroidota bacterium]
MKPEEDVLVSSSAMEPYSGAWTVEEAAHLLRRSLFGPSYDQIKTAADQGLDATITQLLETIPTFTFPRTYEADEPIAAYGTTWVNSVYPSDSTASFNTEKTRRRSLEAWTMERLNGQAFSLQEKMCLFWQNHFAAEPCLDARATYDYFRLIQNHALGNFATFVKEMTVNPNMLIFLNGDENSRFSPNENYARELLELFTIGKGNHVGNGDYTNYTEFDISSGSRILTGWRVEGVRSSTATKVTSFFEPWHHDTGDKTLSFRFGNQVISDGQDQEYKTYIDLILANKETARFICRKLYRWFVSSEISTDVESNVIEEMATLMISSDYEVKPVLEALLKSAHFYETVHRGAIIKNPLEFIFGMINSTKSTPSFDLATTYGIYKELFIFGDSLGMEYAQPPNVGGWTAYYQAPIYSKNWVNSSYMKLRIALASIMTVFNGVEVGGKAFKLDFLSFLDGLSVPQDANQVIEDIVMVFCPNGLEQAQKDALKMMMLDSLPEFEWTQQYADYKVDPQNTTLSEPIRQRMANVLEQVFLLLEFQTN